MNTTTLSPQSRRLADARQVAAMLGISARHVYRLTDAGLMPRPLKLGNCVRWDLDVIGEWINSGCPSCRKGDRR